MTLGVNVLTSMFEYWGVMQGDHKAILMFLIKTDDDLNEFMDKFYTGHIVRDMMKYQKHKRTTNAITFEEFEVLFKSDKKIALESLFQEPILKHQIEYMGMYNVSHKELYERHKENSNESYLALVKRSYCIPDKINDDFLLIT